jgi:hypothetical protein
MIAQSSITVAKATFADVPALAYITIRAFGDDEYTKLVSSAYHHEETDFDFLCLIWSLVCPFEWLISFVGSQQ